MIEQGHRITVTSNANSSTDSPTMPRKRGRPATGGAMTASARQTRWRAKLAAEGKTVLPPLVVSTKVAEALARFVQFKDMTQGEALDKIVGHRLLRKRSGKRKPREPQTTQGGRS